MLPLDPRTNTLPKPLRTDLLKLTDRPRYARFVIGRSREESDRLEVTTTPIAVHQGETIRGWTFTGSVQLDKIWLNPYVQAFGTNSYNCPEVHLVLDSELLRRFELSASAVARWSTFEHGLEPFPRIRNWPSTDFLNILFFETQVPTQLLAGFTIAGLVYGGLHLCAWNAFFSTKAQLILWHISSVTLAVSGVAILLFALYIEVLGRIAEDFGATSFLPWLIFVFCFVLLYIFARVYLVVACFIDIAHIPPSALQIPSWSQYVPHII
jgi:hypothetical protein